MRFGLDLYVNHRPVKLLDARLCPLKGVEPKDVDFVVFRENTEGLYVMMGGNFKKGTREEVATDIDLSTRKGVERIIRHPAGVVASAPAPVVPAVPPGPPSVTVPEAAHSARFNPEAPS